MLALKDDIAVGYSSQRAVLVDISGKLPTKYLNTKSSLVLFAVLNFDDDKGSINFLREYAVFPGKKDIEDSIAKLIDELKDYLVMIDHQEPRSNISLQRLIGEKNNQSGNKYRLDYPVKLVWVPTWKCNRNCLYCGVAKVNPSQAEEQIPLPVMLERFQEAVNQGVKLVNIHGGDPLFCYNDGIYEIIRLLTENNVKVNLSTKNRISEEKALHLKNAGLKRIQLSIDTTKSGLLEKLYGEPDYLAGFEESIRNLKNTGIEITVNVVISNLNYKDVPELLTYLSQLEVGQVSLSNFRKGQINSQDYSLDNKQQMWLFKEIRKIRKSLNFFDFTYTPFTPPAKSAAKKPVCDSGRISLMFLPDGRGCYCDFLSEDERFLFGNLKEQTIEEVWNSDELKSLLNPPPKALEGSGCTGCEGLEYCIERGFCFLTSVSKEMFSPDFKSMECFARKVDVLCD